MALKRAKAFVSRSGASVHDIIKDPLKFLAAHELFALSDPAAIYFFSVHFNLFGGSVLKLGTAAHHVHLEKIDKMETLGCFALTVIGRESNPGLPRVSTQPLANALPCHMRDPVWMPAGHTFLIWVAGAGPRGDLWNESGDHRYLRRGS